MLLLLPPGTCPEDVEAASHRLYARDRGVVSILAVEVLDHPAAQFCALTEEPIGPYLVGPADQVETALVEGGWTGYRVVSRYGSTWSRLSA